MFETLLNYCLVFYCVIASLPVSGPLFGFEVSVSPKCMEMKISHFFKLFLPVVLGRITCHALMMLHSSRTHLLIEVSVLPTSQPAGRLDQSRGPLHAADSLLLEEMGISTLHRWCCEQPLPGPGSPISGHGALQSCCPVRREIQHTKET